MLQSPATVMVVDDDAALAGSVNAVSARRGYSAVLLGDRGEAVRAFRERRPSAVVLGVATAAGDGIELLAALRRIDRDVPVLVVAGPEEPGTAVRAMREGAADFLCKPVVEALLDAALARLVGESRLCAELAALRREIEGEPPFRLVGAKDGPTAEVARMVARVADADATVLLRGEPGTGKERVARAIHGASSRREGPFVKVNCSADEPELLEAALFGFERGSLGGAVQPRPGRLEFANHGTVFFDEIAALPTPLQARLLHVLREGEFCRSGARIPVGVDARVIAATCRDIGPPAADGRFLEELFFHLNVIEVVLLPLRERPEDIRPLVDHFLAKFSVQYNTPRPRLSPETARLFLEHSWPGNVRELEDAVRRVVLGGEQHVQREMLRARQERAAARAAADAARPSPAAAAPGSDHSAPPASGSLKAIARAAAREAERVAISRMLQRTRWNRKEAAEILGISYKALLYKIKENGLDKAPS